MTDQQKVAIITGASRGIGAAIVTELSELGYFIIGTATSEAGAKSIEQKMQDNKISGCGMVLDISSDESVESFYSEIKGKYDNPTVLVNNAGITVDNIMLRMKPDQWGDVINTNLTGAYRMIKGCLKGMVKARWGRIVNMSSVSGVMGNAGQSNYAAAKGGLIAMSKSVARELAGFGITVNCVAPGFTATDMVKDMPEKYRENIQAMIDSSVPLKRMAEPAEIAAAVAFLASEKSGYITGETIQVNGGMLMD